MDVGKPLAFLLLVSGTLFFLNLGEAKLWDEDEPRNAGCAVEMMQRGDWVTPYFNGEIRTHKPVLLYWFMMTAYSVFGVSEFAARFWSAALAVGTVLMTWSIGVRLVGRRAGLLAGFALASMLMFVVAARAATPDSVLIFFITAAMCVYVWTTPAFGKPLHFKLARPFVAWGDYGDQPPSGFPTQLFSVLLMYGLMGVACLDKGPIGFLLPTASIGMFLLIYRLPSSKPISGSGSRAIWAAKLKRVLSVAHPIHFVRTCLSMRLGWMIFAVLAVALPWYIWVTIRTDGQWTRGFFLEHNVGRAVNSMENHGGGPHYYVLALLAGTFPWSIFFLPLVIDLAKFLSSPATANSSSLTASSGGVLGPKVSEIEADSSLRTALTFAVCWVAVIVGLFTLAGTKLPSYITPCYPAAAILVGNYLRRLADRNVRSSLVWPYVSFAVLAFVGVGIAIAIPTVATQFVSNAAPLFLIGIVLIVGSIAATSLWRLGKSRGSVAATAMTSFLFVLLLFGWATARVSKLRQIDRMMSAVKATSDEPKLASTGILRSSWVFYAGCPIKPIDASNAEAVASHVRQGDDHLVIATDAVAEQCLEQYADEVEVVETIPFFLEPGEQLRLLRRVSPNRVAAKPAPRDRH
jgi:4-amino-4-deoxy-L-arabinose transferase-like glycosyltransferase